MIFIFFESGIISNGGKAAIVVIVVILLRNATMSKMDRQLNSKKDKETIYEIYRACRLCGAGAGYKMPIIQSVIDVDDTDVELKQKVRECVQIEVIIAQIHDL